MGTLAKREVLRKSLFSIIVVSLLGFFVLIGEIHNINQIKIDMNDDIVLRRLVRQAEVDFAYKKILIDNFELNHVQDKGYKDELVYWLSQIDINERAFDVVIFDEEKRQIYHNGLYNLEGLDQAKENSDPVYTGNYNKFGWTFEYYSKGKSRQVVNRADVGDYFSAHVATRMFIAVLVCATIFGVFQSKLLNGYIIIKRTPESDQAFEEKFSQAVKGIDQSFDEGLIENEVLEQIHTDGVNLREFIYEIINSYKHINSTNCDYQVMCNEGLTVKFDKKEMARGISSIFENADKHGFSNARGQIVVKVKGEKHHVTISISDNGVGMDREELRYLEQSFKSLDLIDKKNRTSLQHTYQYVVKDLKGEMGVDSTVGLGSTFTLRF